jgi:hypothetical protein
MPHHARIARSNRKLRGTLATLSPLSLAIGLFMLGCFLRYRDTRMLLAALVYAVLSVIMGLSLLILKLAREKRRCERAKKDPSGQRGGMVMILVLLLLGVLTAMTINTQISAGMVLKRARIMRERTELRLAASDAAWYFLRQSSGGGSGAQWASTNPVTLPSGIETEITAKAETNLVLLQFPAFAGEQRRGMHTVQATASRSGRVELVTCLVRRRPNGKMRVLGWIEGQ